MSILFRTRRPTGEQQRSTVRLPQYIVQQLALDGYGVGPIDGDSAMRHDTVWSCRTRIAQDVAMLPVDVVRYAGNGTTVDVSPVPQIVRAPSVNVDSLTWRYQVVDSWLGWGNAWGIVSETSPDMRYPTRIELVSPSSVSSWVEGNQVRFMVGGVERSLWPAGDLWHSPAFTPPGAIVGLSPIAYHAHTVTAGLSAQQYGSDFFTSGGHPHGILAPERDPGPEAAKTIKERFRESARGRDVVVLPASTKYQQIQINPDDSQFIDSQRYSAEQICRIFGEDPADYGVSAGGSSITYANRLDAKVARLERRQFWVVKMQDLLTVMLPQPQQVRLNVNATLMMTPAERAAVHEVRLRTRTRTVNEVRRLEDEPPFPDPEFDEPGIPDVVPAEPAEPAMQEDTAE